MKWRRKTAVPGGKPLWTVEYVRECLVEAATSIFRPCATTSTYRVLRSTWTENRLTGRLRVPVIGYLRLRPSERKAGEGFGFLSRQAACRSARITMV